MNAWRVRKASTAGLIVLASIVVTLAGCGGHSLPPVSDRTAGNERRAVYAVQPGDTLYSIAWRYRLDVNALARANRLPPPYKIRAGGRIVLAEAPAARRNSSAAVDRRSGPSSKPNTQPRPQSNPRADRKPIPTPVSGPERGVELGAGAWRWPTNAPISLAYGARPPGSSRAPANNGVDYALRPSDRVAAAAAGDVVYAGAGLGGFETLIILRHTDDLLSAYSFNAGAATAEGDRVKAGAILADNPGRASGRSRLHFEIRKEGDPVDPSTLIR